MAKTAVVLAQVRDKIRSGEARSLRLAAPLSLAEAAADVGVTPGAIHAYENGQYLPRGEHALRYARLLCDLKRLERELQP